MDLISLSLKTLTVLENILQMQITEKVLESILEQPREARAKELNRKHDLILFSIIHDHKV